MADYKKFLIQQQTFNGTSYTDIGSVIDTNAQWGIVCQECPFKHYPETKDLPKRDWYDEDGEDVFIPSDGLKIKAYDMDVKFLYTGKVSDMSSNLKAFSEFICGRTNIINGTVSSSSSSSKNVLLKIFDEYTNTGRLGVIVQSIDNELFFYNNTSVDAIAQFKVKFHVTNPVYSVKYQNNSLI